MPKRMKDELLDKLNLKESQIKNGFPKKAFVTQEQLKESLNGLSYGIATGSDGQYVFVTQAVQPRVSWQDSKQKDWKTSSSSATPGKLFVPPSRFNSFPNKITLQKSTVGKEPVRRTTQNVDCWACLTDPVKGHE